MPHRPMRRWDYSQLDKATEGLKDDGRTAEEALDYYSKGFKHRKTAPHQYVSSVDRVYGETEIIRFLRGNKVGRHEDDDSTYYRSERGRVFKRSNSTHKFSKFSEREKAEIRAKKERLR